MTRIIFGSFDTSMDNYLSFFHTTELVILVNDVSVWPLHGPEHCSKPPAALYRAILCLSLIHI